MAKAERNVDQPSDLDMQFLGEVLSDFFAEQGWGKLTSLPLGEAVLALDSDNWAEALDQPEGRVPDLSSELWAAGRFPRSGIAGTGGGNGSGVPLAGR